MQKCNLCGKPLTDCDSMKETPLIIDRIGYGSIYDGETLMLQVCNPCLDVIINACRESPLYQREMVIVAAAPELKLIK